MTGNNASVLGNVIYNSGNMSILNLTYINNSTINVKYGQNVTLFANLTDDMDNPVTFQNITFTVNGTYLSSVMANEGQANISYIANIIGLVTVNGDYMGHNGFTINDR